MQYSYHFAYTTFSLSFRCLYPNFLRHLICRRLLLTNYLCRASLLFFNVLAAVTSCFSCLRWSSADPLYVAKHPEESGPIARRVNFLTCCAAARSRDTAGARIAPVAMPTTQDLVW